VKQFEDNVLVELAVSDNDQNAFAELVDRHQSNLRYSMRQLTDWNEALADDLTQEAFIQAFKELHRFRKQAKFSSWLYRIGYNTFLQHVRRKKLDTESLDERASDRYADDVNIHRESNYLIGGGYNDVDSSSDTALHKKLAKLLAALEPERRSVLHLLLHRQSTQQEIATTMGIPLGTVKTHINRGRAALQAGLQDWQS